MFLIYVKLDLPGQEMGMEDRKNWDSIDTREKRESNFDGNFTCE